MSKCAKKGCENQVNTDDTLCPQCLSKCLNRGQIDEIITCLESLEVNYPKGGTLDGLPSG